MSNAGSTMTASRDRRSARRAAAGDASAAAWMPSSRPLVSEHARRGSTPSGRRRRCVTRGSRGRTRRPRASARAIASITAGEQPAGVLVQVQAQARSRRVLVHGRHRHATLMTSADPAMRLARDAAQALGVGQRDGRSGRCGPGPARVSRCTRADAHEVGRAQAAAEPRGAVGRQHVVRAGGVVAGAPAPSTRPTNTAPAARMPARRPLGRRTRGVRARCGWPAPRPRRCVLRHDDARRCAPGPSRAGCPRLGRPAAADRACTCSASRCSR